jgi:hypothetical protein
MLRLRLCEGSLCDRIEKPGNVVAEYANLAIGISNERQLVQLDAIKLGIKYANASSTPPNRTEISDFQCSFLWDEIPDIAGGLLSPVSRGLCRRQS